MVTFLQQVGLNALQRLKDHPLNIRRPMNEPVPCTVIASGPSFRVLLQGFDPTQFDIFPGSVFRIQGGPSNGFHMVTNMGIGYVEADGLTVQAYGKATFFDFDFDIITSVMAASRNACEAYSGQSFSGVVDYNEYRDGNDSVTLICQKRQYRTLASIAFYSILPQKGLLVGIDPNDVDLVEFQTKGILRVTPEAFSGSNNLPLSTLQAKFFPKGKIRVTSTYGWNEDEIPADAQKAIEYYGCAILLTEDMSQSGNVTSFTQDGYTQTGEVGRDIEAYKSLAFALLTPYVSGEVGS